MSMRKRGLYMFLIFVGGLFLLQSCLKRKEYPIIPHIEFKSFVPMGDSARLIFSFTDGDGDLGPITSDAGELQDNVILKYYEKVNGAWVLPNNADGDPIVFPYTTTTLTPAGKNKALKGDMIIYIVPLYYNPFSPNSDTIKYDIRLLDQAGHQSNVVETGEIYR